MSDNLSTLPFLCCYSVCHACLLNTDAHYHNYFLLLFIFYYIYIFFVALRPSAGDGLLILEVSRSHTTTHHNR